MDKSNKVLILSSIVLVGFVFAVIFHYILGFYLNKPYPFNTFLWTPNIAFTDFTAMMLLIKDFAPFKSHNFWLNYFPLSYILLFPFTFIKNRIIAYIVFMWMFLSFFTYTNAKEFKCENLNKIQNFQNIFILTVLSYPVLFVLDRGNFDMFLFIFFAIFVSLYKSEKYLSSSIILAIMNALKPFTFLFLVLLLFKKRYKEFFLSITITGLLIVGGFILLKGNFFDQVNVFLSNLKGVQNFYIYNLECPGIGNNSSLFMALKILLCKLTSPPIISTFILEKIYTLFSLIMAIITIFFAWKEKIFWKQISLLTLYMLVIPPIVNDYKLIFLFVPIYLFVNTKEKSKSDLIYVISFGLLLIPKHYFIVVLMDNFNKLSISGFINPVIMIMLMTSIIREQFSKKRNE